MLEDPILRLFLLGRFAVEYAGRPVPPNAWRRRRPVELLTALALAPGHCLHREELIDRLWPDKELDAGNNNLYRTLHDLRRITGEDAVLVERGAVRLHERSWIDAQVFEEACSSGAPERLLEAIELYRGDLLPDDPYSEVIEPRRQGLRQRFVDLSLRLARQGTELDPDRRIVIMRRLLEIDRSIEEGHRLLMAALAEAGRPKDALRQFASCVEALREQLGVEPSTETRRLIDRIKSGELQGSRAGTAREDNWSQVATRLLGTAAPRPIRGRARELELVSAFAESDRGALLIVGEAGAGKTRLAVECARRCARGGAVVIAGLGCDFDGAAPYSPFVDAWTDFVRLVPGGQGPFLSFEPTPGGSAQEDRLRLFRAVEQSVAELAGAGRACIVIEDLHQADESSLHLFHHLVRASRHLPLQLIGTVRQEEIRPGNPLHVLLSSLGRERMTTRLSLERLDLEATRALMHDLWGRAPEEAAVEETFRLAAGNPFYTEEVAAALREGDTGSFTPSSDLLATVRARMSRRGAQVERLLAAASVQGVRFDFEIARRAIGLAQEDALDALDAALAARLIEEQADRYRFRHALMREAFHDSLSQARRVYLHRSTVEALEARGGPDLAHEPEVLAFHHHAAGNLDRALPYTLAAIARAQSRLGFGEAVTHSARALELMEALGLAAGPDGFRVLRDLGAMRVALGDLETAVRDLDRAASLGQSGSGWAPGPAARCGALRLAGLALIEAGDLDAAEAHLDAALAALGGLEDPSELCNVHYLYSQLRWHQSRHEEAFELAERCLAVAEKAGDEEAIAKGYEMLALACHSLGEWKKGRQYEEQRREVADGTLDVASAFDVHL
jgi:DNA-binding SARP family transcriptional activator/tetratricopeptide (TPR) repeat protein